MSFLSFLEICCRRGELDLQTSLMLFSLPLDWQPEAERFVNLSSL